MKRQFTPPIVLLCTSIAIPAAVLGQDHGAAGEPVCEVSVHASVEAVVPASPFEVAIQFDLPDDWHIYWQNAGEAGSPPVITWTLPDGFTAGPLRFPIPHRHVDRSGVQTNILTDTPVLLARMIPPDAIAEERITLDCLIDYEMGNDVRAKRQARVALDLPIASPGSEPEVANQELFDDVRLPKKQSSRLSISSTIPETEFVPGRLFNVLLTINVAKGMHVQSNRPLSPAFIACQLFFEQTPGITLGDPVYPKPQTRQVPYVGRVSEFGGTFTVRIPAVVGDTPPTDPVAFGGLLTFQACNDKGICFRPETISFSVPGDDTSQRQATTPAEAPDQPISAQPSAPPPDSALVTKDVEDKSAKQPIELAPQPSSDQTVATADEDPEENDGLPKTLLGWLGLGFLGGLILNIMPCVLPVISIKILSFVQQAKEDPRRVFALGVTFAAGIVISFEVLVAIIILLKSGGHAAGWGFQLQSPIVVIAMMGIFFAFGLSLFGLFDITLPGATVTKLSAAEEREGYLGAFLKGALATVLATPCMAPFLAPALGYAFTHSNTELILVFNAVAFGMALPYVLLTANPAWLRLVPKPGMWMEHFKQFMGFVLMGTVVYLLLVLGDLIGAGGAAWSVGFLCFLGLAAWILGKQTPSTTLAWRLTAWGVAIVFVVGGWWVCLTRNSAIKRGELRQREIALALEFVERSSGGQLFKLANLDFSGKFPWQRWWKGRPEELAEKGMTVFVDYTATWCVTCQANKKATMESAEVRKKMDELGVVPIKGDNTRKDPEILKVLKAFGSAGVPLNIIYPAGKPDEPIVLPVQLVGRIGLVLEKLDEAGPSNPKE